MTTKMTTIKTSLVDPNPHRDLKLHPVDKTRVKDIADSYERHGDWGGIAIRPHPTKPGRYQRAFGEHRFNAAAEAGLKELNVTIGVWNDFDMGQMLIAENATQQGMNAACINESVWVAAKMIAKAALGTDEVARNLATLRKLLGGKSALTQIRESLLAGDGLGEKLIASYPWQKSLSTYEIRAAVNQLRDSGAWVDLLSAVYAEFVEEGDTEAAKRIDAALSKPVPADQSKAPIYDRDATSEFATTAQAEAFRKVVTSPVAQLLTTPKQHRTIARAVVDQLSDKVKGTRNARKVISADAVGKLTSSLLSRGLFVRAGLEASEAKKLQREAADQAFPKEVQAQLERLRQGLNTAYPAALELQSLAKQGIVSFNAESKVLVTLRGFKALIPWLETCFSTTDDIEV